MLRFISEKLCGIDIQYYVIFKLIDHLGGVDACITIKNYKLLGITTSRLEMFISILSKHWAALSGNGAGGSDNDRGSINESHRC